jgi:4-amino-4-deoxy-L-arabinose transferase-like glycosyltransferase
VIDSVRGRAVPLLLIAVAFAVRLVAGEVVLSNGRAFLPDSELYWGYAESLAKDGVYQVGGAGARRTPGYPLFIVGCTKLLGDANPLVPPPLSQLRAVLIAQALLGALVVGMVWSLAQSMFAGDSMLRHAAIWAGLVAAFDPFSISLGAMILSETLFTVALVASVWCAMKSVEGERNRSVWVIAAGVAAGFAVLVRPSGLLLVPIGLIAIGRRWGLRNAFVSIAAFALVMTPWVIRNANVYHAFVPTTLNVGESLYDGWNPEAEGGSNMAFVDRRKLAHGAAQTPADEIAEDAFWKREAIDWAKNHPGRVLELAARKLARFWSPWPNAAEFQSTAVVVGCGLFSLIAYGGAMVGLVVLRRGSWQTVLLALTPAVYFMALHAVFVSSVRYRVPAMPMLELLTGVGLAWLTNRRLATKGKEA